MPKSATKEVHDFTLTQYACYLLLQNRESKKDAAKLLKKKDFTEGRKPNYLISVQIAEITNQKAEYTRNKGLD